MNAFTQAFVNAAVKSSNDVFAKHSESIGNALKGNKDFKEGWSFSGSYKTYQALKAQGKLS